MYRVATILFFLFLPATAFALDYTPLVSLPFVGSGTQDIGGYLRAIFQLLIGLAGLMAVVRMVICGFQAIMSLSPSARAEASQCVLGGLTGLLLAFSSYLILNQINPTILNTDFNPPSLPVNPLFDTGGPIGENLPEGAPRGNCDARNLCQGEVGPACNTANAACRQYDAAARAAASRAGVSEQLVREVMAQESSCNPTAGSSVGACGLMQLLPSTAQQHKAACGIPALVDVSCSWLQNPANAVASICLGAMELRSLQRGRCSGGVHQVIAGYNGGPGACMTSQSCPAPMVSCTGGAVHRWECPYDGTNMTACNTGYQETRTYVRRFIQCGL